MLPRSQSDNFANGLRPKKKPAPPRPPQPSQSKLQNSQSFRGGTQSGKGYTRSLSVSHADSGRPTGSDLIDFSTPPGSPPKGAQTFIPKLEANRPLNEFMYRVGASIFYVKSPLKNSESDNQASLQQPFSPPRPSAQSLLSSPMKTVTATSENQGVRNPTIIRAYGGGSTSSNNSNSSGSTINQINNANNSNNNWNSQQHTAQTRYSNVPLTWDEPPKPTKPVSTHPPIAPKPTIIRPPISTSNNITPPSLAPSTNNNLNTTKTSTERNYYDLPPESDEENDEESAGDDSFASPPMPDEPPPPPPPDLEVEQWVEGTTDADNYYEHYPEAAYQTAEGDQPYAIVLYDYVSDVEGDLNLQTGDLVYLIKRVDDSWLYGMCGGVEGMFPTGYVNIVVPLAEEQDVEVPQAISSENHDNVNTTDYKQQSATALYQFVAETENDLSLEPGDVVMIWGRINDDWLYGALNRQRGQFPAAFVSPVPTDLPIIES